MPRSAAASPAPDIVGLGPVGVSVTALGPTWADSLASALGPLGPGPSTAALAMVPEPWGEVPSDALREIGSGLSVAHLGGDLLVQDEVAGVRARAVGGRIALSTSSGGAQPCGRVLPFALAPSLLDAGAHLVHGAVVVDASRAVLVVGPTGSGKSTAVAAARSAGLDVAGDDLGVVWLDGDTWRVHGLARPVRVPPELAPGSAPVVDDARGRVSPEGWATGGEADLVGVVLVRHGDEGALVAADPVAVARSVLASCFATVLPRCVAPSLAMGRGLAELPGWELQLAADPTARPAAAGRDLRAAFA